MSTAAIVGGSLAGAGISAFGSNAAAGTQAKAADQAAQLQFELGQENLAFQKQQYGNTLGLLEPQYMTGIESLGDLANLMGLTPQGANTSIFSNPFGANGGPQLPNNIPGVGPVGSPSSTAGITSPLAMDANGVSATVPNGTVQANANPAMLTVPNGTSPNGAPGAATGGLPPGFLTQLFNNGQGFTAPTLDQARQDPGYQFTAQQGSKALENSAAAKGNLVSGNEMEALDQFNTGLADTTYNNVYNRALNNFQTNYNAFNTNQSNIFNRFATLAGMGQTSSGQLASAGLQTGSNIGNLLTGLGGQIGGDIQNAGAARASGYAGIANALSGGVGGISQLALLSSLLNKGGGSNAPFDPSTLGIPF